MFSPRNLRLGLFLMGLTVSLGILAIMRSTTAQVPNNLKSVALQRVSKLSGLPLNRLTVVNSATAKYQRKGETVFKVKVTDNQSGKIYGLTLDNSGEELSATQLQASEQAASAAQYGKLEPALAQRLTGIPQNQPLRVIIWLKQPSNTGASRPAPNPSSASRASQAQVNAFFEQVDAQRAAKVQPIVSPVANKLKSFGSNVRTEKYSPVVYASLTPQAIKQVAQWGEVDQIYQERQVQPNLDVARQVIAANVVNNRGFTGSGVKVAQIEVGGIIATNNPYLSGTTQDTTYGCLSSHSTGVAGIIRSTHPKARGIAPGVLLWAGGSCGGWPSELQNRSTSAADWGAEVFNLSLGGDFGVDSFAKFYDDMVINRYRTVVIAAGNSGNTGNVSSPATAYNVISVGSFDDQNTTSWTDDIISPFSSGKDPSSTHGDREKPEVAAPGQNINSTTNSSPWTGPIGSGTSYASPMVAGVAAQMIQRNSSLGSWPEAVKAILMTTAVHNIEGNTRLSELDGTGGIVADRADDVAHGVGGSWGGQPYSCSEPSSVDVATVGLTGGQRTRSTIVWNQNPNYSSYSSQPSADLDFQIVNSSGSVVAGSYSYDNTSEIVDFTPNSSGTYKLRVSKYRCDMSPQWLGWAWRQGN